MLNVNALTKQGRKTIAEVKDALHVESLNNIPKIRIIQFANNLKDMDPELALKCIENVPDFANFTNTIIGHYSDVCAELAESSRKESIEALRVILGDLSIIVNRENISEDMHKYVIDQMMYVAHKISEEEDKKDRFKKAVMATVGTITTAGVVVVGAAVGVVTKGKFSKR